MQKRFEKQKAAGPGIRSGRAGMTGSGAGGFPAAAKN